MRKYLFWILTCIVVLFLLIGGCKDNSSTEVTTQENQPEVEEVDTIRFDSLEEFNDYLTFAKSEEDIAELKNLKKYYLPTAIPPEYELYKITAGIKDIGFWYLPRTYLEEDQSLFLAEAQQMYYLFISPRYDDSIETVYDQFGVSKENRGEQYYVHNLGNRNLIFWEQDGTVFGLYTPKTEDSQNSKNTQNNQAFDFSVYCEAKAFYID